MLLIPCPFCGPRDETEFTCGGQAGVAYPDNRENLTDEEWAAYVFLRDNPKGWFNERWAHTAGCRTWFAVWRHTVTHEIKPATVEIAPVRPDVKPMSDETKPGDHRAR